MSGEPLRGGRGRRGEISDEQRVRLLVRAERLVALQSEVAQARADLAAAVVAAQEAGASVRVIAEAISLGPSTVHEIIRSSG